MSDARFRAGSAEVVLARGDITLETTDAIVNAANAGLLGGGGVDGAIHEAAGPQLLVACRAIVAGLPRRMLPTGDAVATPGFLLAARHVIHCVGPIYGDEDGLEAALLASCHSRALALARELGARSIAFPAISTGVYGYPMNEAGRVALGAVRRDIEANGGLDLVRFVLFGGPAYDAFLAAAKSELSS